MFRVLLFLILSIVFLSCVHTPNSNKNDRDGSQGISPAGLIGSDRGKDTDVNLGTEAILIDGKLILRDLAANVSPVLSNRNFLYGYPKFISLIKDLAEVHPFFAYSVWEDLLSARLWVTEKELTVLTMSEAEQDAQVAVRQGNDIIFSPSKLNQVGGEYVLLKMALINLLEGRGSIHLKRVETVLNYLKEHKENFSLEEMNKHFADNGISWKIVNTSARMDHIQKEALSLILREEGPSKSRCQLAELIVADHDLYLLHFSDIKADVLEKWGKYAQCPRIENPLNYFFTLYPEFNEHSKVNQIGSGTKLTWLEKWYTENPSSADHSDLAGDCTRHADQNNYLKIQKMLELLKELNKMREKLATLNIDSTDEATFYYLKLVEKYDPRINGQSTNLSQVGFIRQQIIDAWENYTYNRQWCSKFKDKYSSSRRVWKLLKLGSDAKPEGL